MCEKCNNKKSFGGNPFTKIITGFGLPVELICPPGINPLEVMMHISEYVTEHGKAPSPKELAQYILSSKAKASSATKDRGGCPNRLEVLEVRKAALLRELEVLNVEIIKASGEKSNEGVERSFDQLVADATAELDVFMSALEDKYNEDIVTLAAEKIMAFPVEDLDEDDGNVVGKVDDIFQRLHVVDDNLDVLGKMIYETHQAIVVSKPITGTLESTIGNPYIPELVETLIEVRGQIKTITDFTNNDVHYDTLRKISKKLKKAINKCYTAQILDIVTDDEEVEDITKKADKEFDSALFGVLEVLTRARKALRSEMILEHDVNSDRRKQLQPLVDEMDTWINKLHYAFGDR